MMKTNKLVKLGIATFAVAVLGVVPAFTAQADTHVAEQPNTASKPVENGKPSDSEKPEVKPAEEAKPEAKSTATAGETQPSDTSGGDATLNKEKHLPIRYVIELDFKDIRTWEEVEPTKTLTGTVNFGEDLTIDAPTFEGYRLRRVYPKSLNISYDNLNNFGEAAGSEAYEVYETSKDREYTLTKEGDTIIAHRRLEYETLPLEKPNRSERTLHINFSYTGTPKIWPDGTLPLHRPHYSIDNGKRNITVTIKPGESFTLPKGDIEGYILERIEDAPDRDGRTELTSGNFYKPGETVPYEKFNFYPAVVDGVESDHISVSYSYYRPAGYIGWEKPSQPTEKPAPKADENQEPIKYRIDYFDADTGERISREYGVLNPGETVNIHKNIDGYEVVSNDSWMPGYNVDYRIMSRYFGGQTFERYMFLDYKKVKADAKPSETPKPAPKDEENQEPLKYRIDYFDADTGKEISREYGVLNPGETINIHKNIDGYEVVSDASWMPGYKVNYRIMSEYFGGSLDERYMFLDYKKVNADAKPSDTSKPEVKPETKPSDTSKPEVKPETKPSDTPKPEVKPETKPSDTPKPEVKPETKPSETPKPEVKPETKPSETPKPEVKPKPKPSETPKPEVKPEPKSSDTSKPVIPAVPDQSQPAKPEKPAEKPSEKLVVPDTPKPVTPAVPDQPQPAKPEKPVTPSTSRILANEIGSVQVRASEETLKNVSYIKVEETKSNSLTAKNYKAYDIRLYDANGKAVQPNGMVLVSLSAEKPVENVYYVSPDGALQALDFKQDADKVTFETNHFSIYAMTFKNLSVNHNNGSIQTPVAGSENPTTPTQNSNGIDGTQPQSKPLKTKGEGGEKTTKTLPNTGENSSILTTLFGVLTLNAGLFSYRKKEK